jgi:hypothetical protein
MKHFFGMIILMVLAVGKMLGKLQKGIKVDLGNAYERAY